MALDEARVFLHSFGDALRWSTKALLAASSRGDPEDLENPENPEGPKSGKASVSLFGRRLEAAVYSSNLATALLRHAEWKGAAEAVSASLQIAATSSVFVGLPLGGAFFFASESLAELRKQIKDASASASSSTQSFPSTAKEVSSELRAKARLAALSAASAGVAALRREEAAEAAESWLALTIARVFRREKWEALVAAKSVRRRCTQGLRRWRVSPVGEEEEQEEETRREKAVRCVQALSLAHAALRTQSEGEDSDQGSAFLDGEENSPSVAEAERDASASGGGVSPLRVALLCQLLELILKSTCQRTLPRREEMSLAQSCVVGQTAAREGTPADGLRVAAEERSAQGQAETDVFSDFLEDPPLRLRSASEELQAVETRELQRRLQVELSSVTTLEAEGEAFWRRSALIALLRKRLRASLKSALLLLPHSNTDATKTEMQIDSDSAAPVGLCALGAKTAAQDPLPSGEWGKTPFEI